MSTGGSAPRRDANWTHLELDWVDLLGIVGTMFSALFVVAFVARHGAQIVFLRYPAIVVGLLAFPIVRRRWFGKKTSGVARSVTSAGLASAAIMWLGVVLALGGVFALYIAAGPPDERGTEQYPPAARAREIARRDADNAGGLRWGPVMGLVAAAMIAGGGLIERKRVARD